MIPTLVSKLVTITFRGINSGKPNLKLSSNYNYLLQIVCLYYQSTNLLMSTKRRSRKQPRSSSQYAPPSKPMKRNRSSSPGLPISMPSTDIGEGKGMCQQRRSSGDLGRLWGSTPAHIQLSTTTHTGKDCEPSQGPSSLVSFSGSKCNFMFMYFG